MIALVLRFLPFILTGFTAIGGLGLNYWLGVTDWRTALVLAVSLTLVTYISQSESKWGRWATTAVLLVGAYVIGAIHKEEELVPRHKLELTELHTSYEKKAEQEIQRQVQENLKALHHAEKAKEQSDAELATLRQELEQLRDQAAKDVAADHPALSRSAVDRLNRFRLRSQPES